MLGNFKHQLCRGTTKHIEKGGVWLGQPKLDGMRVAIFKKGGQLYVLSRNLKQQPCIENYSWIVQELEERGIDLHRVLIDGEVIAANRFIAIGLSHRQSLLSSEEKDQLILRPFDAIPIDRILEGRITHATSYRIGVLEGLLDQGSKHVQPVETVTLMGNTVRAAETYYETLLAQGHEGAVFKRADAPYKFGNSQFWVKMKADFDEDLRVIEVLEGIGKFEGTLGSFVVDRQGVRVHVGSLQVDDAERHKLWQQRDELIGKVIEVRHFGETPDGSLTHAIFVCVRWDKS